MSEPRRHHRYTYADYVALDMYSTEKHEFLDGEIYAMAGGSEEHSALAAAMVHALVNAVGDDSPCRVHTSDLRIYVEPVGLATFPDCSVIYGPLLQHEPSPKATALNPAVLVEVTSDSSEEYDRGPKLEYYRTIPTLREYVIVSHRERRIVVETCGDDGRWTSCAAAKGERITIASLDAEIIVDEVYRHSSVV